MTIVRNRIYKRDVIEKQERSEDTIVDDNNRGKISTLLLRILSNSLNES